MFLFVIDEINPISWRFRWNERGFRWIFIKMKQNFSEKFSLKIQFTKILLLAISSLHIIFDYFSLNYDQSASKSTKSSQSSDQ